MNETISYYDNNAEEYYRTTVNVDMDALRNKFASLLPDGANVIDMGCGSGRDVRALSDMGFHTVGLDASTELAEMANEKLGVDIIEGDMSKWVSDTPYDGIWCCASIIHLTSEEKKAFFRNLEYNLKEGGIIYISVKEGIEEGSDDKGRYINNSTLGELEQYLTEAGCVIIETSSTKDRMKRDTTWLNVIGQKRK